ncbi:hypothetical protein TNCV_486071 [Trichonephila clavipes]|nr:hypothetical protein TNCV_486071 [Trichonephila clavipes]
MLLLDEKLLRVRSRNTCQRVSHFDKGRIVAYRNCGLSYQSIVARVGRDPMTVSGVWNRWVLVEESRLCLQHQDGRFRVRWHRGKRALTAYIRLHHTGQSPRVMAWVAIGYTPWSHLVHIDGTLNRACYISAIVLACPFIRSFTSRKLWSMVGQRLACHHTPVTTVDEQWYRVEVA